MAHDAAGLILAVDAQLYANGGCSLDLSRPVLERALFHIENAYHVPHLRVVGRVCRTNLPSNTAFRGFGGPQVPRPHASRTRTRAAPPHARFLPALVTHAPTPLTPIL